jgi:hypothetical protein
MIVPASRAEAYGWRIITWALFGNDLGGLYGERDHNWVNNGNTEKTFWTAVRWWCRNPMHNLFWHVLDWPRPMAVVFYDGAWFYKRPPAQWLSEDSHFQATALPLYIGFRTSSWEGYLGWRGEAGRLGFTIRRR